MKIGSRSAKFSVWLGFLLVSALVKMPVRGAPIWVPIKPSETDSRIHEFNTPHFVYVDREILLGGRSSVGDRHELLLFLTGTGGQGRGPKAFLETAASLGYHVINLMYPDDLAAAAVCAKDPDPDSFEKFRMALIEGGASPHITVEVYDSIDSRLFHLLKLLAQKRPRERWGQFLSGDGIAWDRVAVSGQSQGGGHAALIAVKHRVSRVLMFGAPKDYSLQLNHPAKWYSEGKATPSGCFFAINHKQDHQGFCPYPLQLENLRALGMQEEGDPVEVDDERPPYRHSHMLFTNYPGSKVDSKTAHTTAINDKNEQVFRKTWIYMLTAQTK